MCGHGLPGTLVAIDGPSGSGKTTLVKALLALLNERGVAARAVKETQGSVVGWLACHMEGYMSGRTYARVIAWARRWCLKTRVLPALSEGLTVVMDRYVLSSFILQCWDGVSQEEVLRLNRHAPLPDLQVCLTLDDGLTGRNLAARRSRSRFERETLRGAAYASPETRLMAEGEAALRREGMRPALHLDGTGRTPEEGAEAVVEALSWSRAID